MNPMNEQKHHNDEFILLLWEYITGKGYLQLIIMVQLATEERLRYVILHQQGLSHRRIANDVGCADVLCKVS